MRKLLKSALTMILVAVMVMATVSVSFASADGINPFTDVNEDAYYFDAVLWAYANGITTGTTATKFAPADTCTRGQVVTFLWRAAGEPEPETKENRFNDVKNTDYYYKPVLWAVENGITTGTSEKMFSPDVTCTNAHILTFIWRALGEEGKTGEGEWYDDAVNWAAESGMLKGTFTGTFVPSGKCPRANVVTYLFRYDNTSSTVARIYVSANGDDGSADGTLGKPFATIEAARDHIRTMDKTGYTGIVVKIAKGEYAVKEAIKFTKEDSGTKDCPVTYEGVGGVSVIGGVKLYAKDFKKAEGGLTEYFPEEARDKIVSVELDPYGISDEIIQKAMENRHYHETIPFLSANGDRQMLAQYPNDWLHIDGAETFDSKWQLTDTDDNDAEYQRISYGEAHAATVQSWSEVLPVFVRARIYKLWCPDDSKIITIYKDKPQIDIYFNGGHEPAAGTILYFYNVPEALDIPGEYIIDKNAVLYYYPTETFETDVLSLPRSEGLVRAENVSYFTIKNISFTTCLDDGLVINGDHVTLEDCTVAGIQEKGISISGDANRIDGCTVHGVGEDGIVVRTGDNENAEGEGTVVYNCDVYDCSVTNAYGYCITASGVNLLISHNDCHDSNFKGIHIHSAVNAVIEYNDVWNMMLLSDDVGAISGDGMENANNVFRYNYVHDIGPAGEAAKMKEYNPDYSYMGSFAFYFDGGCSYMEVCNNVVAGCETGYLSNGGRGNSCHNNIFADCREWYIWFSEIMYSGKVNDDGTLKESHTSFSPFVYNSVWKELNPDLASLKTTTVGVDPNDPLLWCAPAGDTCYDNVIYFNKADRNFSNWGVRPYNIETYVRQFSADGIKLDGNTVLPGTIHSYSSARKDIVIEEVVSAESEILGMTLEQFRSIGRID